MGAGEGRNKAQSAGREILNGSLPIEVGVIWVFFCQSSHSFVFTIGTCNFFPDSVVVDPSFTHLRQVRFIVQNCLNIQGLLHSAELPKQ